MIGLPIQMIDRPSGPPATDVAALLQLDALWARTRGDPRIRIALLDGPVDRSHICFTGAQLSILPTLAGGNAADSPACRHGTHVASLIFGQPGGPVAGVAPACTGLVLPVFSAGTDSVPVLCSQLDLARAILQAIEAGAHVINISGGQLTPTGEPDPMLAHAMAACADANVLLVAAAGNDGCECLHVPAALAFALAVGALDGEGQPLDVSNWGAAYRSQGLLAPGMNIPGALPGNEVGLKSGTSFATPLVAGVAALLLSMQLKRGAKPDPQAVRAALIGSAFPCDPQRLADCRRYLAGRVNPAGALDLINRNVTHSGGVPDMNDTTTLQPHESSGLSPSAAGEASAAPPSQPAASIEDAVVAAEAPMQPPATPQPRGTPSGLVGLSDCGCGCGGDSKESCSCGGGNKTVQLVYALGKIGYDFGSEARRDRFIQYMGDPTAPFDPVRLNAYLADNPEEAASLTWTLNLDATPIYAIVPSGSFSELGYRKLREALEGQSKDGVDMVSVPGYVGGSTTLMSGQTVPVIVPALRGLHAWPVAVVVKSLLGARPTVKAEQALYDARLSGVNNFLSRIYYDLRNLGLTGPERALNFAATNAFQATRVFEIATQDGRELDSIGVRKSPVCRPDSECYDVEVSFFGPDNVLKANRVFRFTVDVSDVIPVTIGDIRSFAKRA